MRRTMQWEIPNTSEEFWSHVKPPEMSYSGNVCLRTFFFKYYNAWNTEKIK